MRRIDFDFDRLILFLNDTRGNRGNKWEWGNIKVSTVALRKSMFPARIVSPYKFKILNKTKEFIINIHTPWRTSKLNDFLLNINWFILKNG